MVGVEAFFARHGYGWLKMSQLFGPRQDLRSDGYGMPHKCGVTLPRKRDNFHRNRDHPRVAVRCPLQPTFSGGQKGKSSPAGADSLQPDDSHQLKLESRRSMSGCGQRERATREIARSRPCGGTHPGRGYSARQAADRHPPGTPTRSLTRESTHGSSHSYDSPSQEPLSVAA